MHRIFTTTFTAYARAAVVAGVLGASVTAGPAFAGGLGSGLAAEVPHYRDIRDLGRARSDQRVDLTFMLQYRDQAGLEALVRRQSDRHSPLYHRWLTRPQFLARFAPSPEDHARAVAALRGAGFTVTKTFANRTMIDASAPSSVAERYFRTEIHGVQQAGHGLRYMNVRPALMPDALRGIVRNVVGLSSVIDVRPNSHAAAARNASPRGFAPTLPAAPISRALQPEPVDAQTEATLRTMLPARPAQAQVKHDYGIPLSFNYVADPGFESGSLSGPWVDCGGGRPVGISGYSHTGSSSALAGAGSPEVNGYSMVCQYFGSAPNWAEMTWWTYLISSDTSKFSIAYVYDYTLGKFFTWTYSQANTLGRQPLGWQNFTVDLKQFGGHPIWIYLGVTGTGANALRYEYIDDASIYSYSGPRGTPLSGSSYGPAGFSPLGLAKAYDMPVQHGWDGAGHSVGVVIDGDVPDGDLATYLAQFGITRYSWLYHHVNIDGPPGTDSLEPHLDIEMIASLAPTVDLTIYTIPDLSYVHILDAYNWLVSNGYPEIVNSSFGGCDLGFGDQTNQIALQGAAYGMTFSASSGDGGGNGCGGTIEVPSSDPYFVSVGATSLYLNAKGGYSYEVGWAGSGGGVSPHFSEPYWQQWAFSSYGRNVPDIAFNGSDKTPVSVYAGGGWWYTWGTSVSSPIYCAVQSEVNEREESLAGDVHPSLYSAWLTQYGYNKNWGFHDVISGNNGPFNAGAGYDNVTGIGSADGFDLARIE
jgi:subtilase family serine protease